MNTVKEFLKRHTTLLQQVRLRSLVRHLLALPHTTNLTRLARVFGSDKWGAHAYTPHYQAHFAKWAFTRINLLEIGVGGYAHPLAGGESLRMWKRFFPFGRIYGLDLYDKTALEERRIHVFQGDQGDPQVLLRVATAIGEIDIIIDDGSHINEHVIATFKTLFPLLKQGGIYAIEDTQTSYWPEFGGDSEDLLRPSTSMNYVRSLVDGLNYREIIRPGYQPTYLDQNISSIHFYRNLTVVYKGSNMEESNRPNVDLVNPA
jgi:demethylmacrocin O-methyltransferase